ncbi:MAG: RNA 2',3'-cyclic phosphodiesterase [Sphingomonas sp.]|jgi:2'-5' RNA ligase
MHRLFVGLRPPPEIRALLRGAMGGIGGARWQDDDQLHLTVRFIGEVDGRTADDIAVALGHVHADAIDVAINGVGRFDKKGRTDAIWAGVTPHDALAALHRKVDHAIVRCGQPPEGRAYLPHITLARMPRSLVAEAEVQAFLGRQAGLASAPFGFTHLTLFESALTHDGARYQPVTRWPLG